MLGFKKYVLIIITGATIFYFSNNMSCPNNYHKNAREIINDFMNVLKEFYINSSKTPSPTNSIINKPEMK